MTMKRKKFTKEELKKSRYIWLKDVSKFTDNQKILFEEINNVNFETARAWQIKENFRDIVFGQKPDVAIQLFDNWCEHAQKSEIAPIIKIVEMFKLHRQGIINAIELNKSNGMAERLNGKIQETKPVQKDTELLKISELRFYSITGNYLFTHKKHSRNIFFGKYFSVL